MKIDNNELEKRAINAFKQGDAVRANQLQDEFLAQFHAAYDGKDHCSCNKACKHHGNCLDCVAIHRAHMDHLPNCFHPMVNQKLQAVSALSEHSFNKQED